MFSWKNKNVRSSAVRHDTAYAKISLILNLDGTGQTKLDTGIPFLEHMLEQFARHAMMDLEVNCAGDVQVDDHHSVEQIGIALGKALKQALADKTNVCRIGHAYVPQDEALSRAVVDLCGRAHLHYQVDFIRERVGQFDVDLFREFFQGLSNHAMLTLHIDNLHGSNAHHQAETVFKAFGRALRMATEYDTRAATQNS